MNKRCKKCKTDMLPVGHTKDAFTYACPICGAVRTQRKRKGFKLNAQKLAEKTAYMLEIQLERNTPSDDNKEEWFKLLQLLSGILVRLNEKVKVFIKEDKITKAQKRAKEIERDYLI